jgi:hypothetical protein
MEDSRKGRIKESWMEPAVRKMMELGFDGLEQVVDGAMENVVPQTDAANGKKQTADQQSRTGIELVEVENSSKTVRVATSHSDSRVVKRWCGVQSVSPVGDQSKSSYR